MIGSRASSDQARPRRLRRPRPAPLAAVAVAALLPAGAAQAHDFFLIPAAAFGRPGGEVAIAMHVSEVFPGEPTAWRVKRTREFFLVDGEGRLDLAGAPLAGEPPRARVTLRAPGTAVVALVTEATYIEIEPGAFEDYLRMEGHADVLGARAGSGDAARPGRERYTRFVKTLVHAGAPTPVPLRPVGLKIEIVPEADPAAARPGSDLPVRVLFDGRPYAGGYLCATYAGHSEAHDAYAWCGRTGAEGRAEVPIRAPGWQLLRITRMVPRRGDPRADWESFWAALTFLVPREAS
jgi:hypothetical protein